MQALTPPPAPEPQRSSWFLRVLFVLLIAGLVVEVIAIAALMGFTLLTLNSDSPAMLNVRSRPVIRLGSPFSGSELMNVDVWDRHGPLNVLLLGLDEDDCLEPDGTYRRTDTLILVRIDPRARRAAMLTIPRDLYVSVPVHVEGQEAPVILGRKINTAHLFGERDTALAGGGPELVKQVVEENLGIPVHRFARIDYKAFVALIDGLGGIDLDVPPSPADPTKGLYDPYYPDGKCGTMVVEFPPGPQHVDGKRALQYARSRSTTGDFDRSRRQMEVLLAIRDRALSLELVTSLHEIVPVLLRTVDTNFSPRELISLAKLARDIGPDSIVTYQIDADVVYDQWLIIDQMPQAVLRLKPTAFAAVRDSFLTLGVEEVTSSAGGEGGVN